MVSPNLLDARTTMKKSLIAKANKSSKGEFKDKALALMGASKGTEKRGHSPGEARKKLYGSK